MVSFPPSKHTVGRRLSASWEPDLPSCTTGANQCVLFNTHPHPTSMPSRQHWTSENVGHTEGSWERRPHSALLCSYDLDPGPEARGRHPLETAQGTHHALVSQKRFAPSKAAQH